MSSRFSLRAIGAGFLLVFLYVVLTVVSYFYFTASRMTVTEPLSPVPEKRGAGFAVSPLPTVTGAPANVYSVLLLGLGGPDHPGGGLTDSLTVVSVDADRKSVALVSIPRDLWIAFPNASGGTVQRKINFAYADGGGELAKQVVSGVIGFPVQSFVAVDFDGFRKAIDALGGIEVRVPVTFDDYYFPVPGKENETCEKSPEEVEKILTELRGFEIDKQFPCRFRHVHFEAGVQQMDGETALVFVRSRHSAQHGGDFARLVRVQAVLLGIKERLLALGAVDDAVSFFNQLSRSMRTDLTPEAVAKITGAVGDTSEYTSSGVLLTTENVLESGVSSEGGYILVPKQGEGWESVHTYIREELEKYSGARD